MESTVGLSRDTNNDVVVKIGDFNRSVGSLQIVNPTTSDAILIGGIVGGLFGVIILFAIILLLVLLYKSKTKSKSQSHEVVQLNQVRFESKNTTGNMA